MDPTLVLGEVTDPTASTDITQLKAKYEVDKLAIEIQKLGKETEKVVKEAEKVELELKDLRRRWWQRPQMIAAFLPTFLAFGTLLTAYLNGWFQVESKRLENVKWDLKKDVDNLEQDKRKISTERTAMRRRLADDSATVAMERAGMQVRLAAERAANEQRISAERSKANLLIASVRVKAKIEKRALEKEGQQYKYRSMFDIVENDDKLLVGLLGKKHVNSFINGPLKAINRNTVALASQSIISTLKKRDSKAEALRAVLVQKVDSASRLKKDAIGVYLYSLYKGTGEPIWKTQFLARARLVADQLRNQPASADTDDIEESAYLNLFALPGWSSDDRVELAMFLVGFMHQLNGQPYKQSEALFLFAQTLGPNAKEYGSSFCHRHPKEFVYLLQLSRDIVLAPTNFPAGHAADFNTGRLQGAECWLSTHAPAAMLSIIAHAVVTYPRLKEKSPDLFYLGEPSQPVVSNVVLIDKMFSYTADGLIKNVGTNALKHLPKYESSNPNTQEWRAWNASHPNLQIWLAPNLTPLTNDPDKLFKGLWVIKNL